MSILGLYQIITNEKNKLHSTYYKTRYPLEISFLDVNQIYFVLPLSLGIEAESTVTFSYDLLF